MKNPKIVINKDFFIKRNTKMRNIDKDIARAKENLAQLLNEKKSLKIIYDETLERDWYLNFEELCTFLLCNLTGVEYKTFSNRSPYTVSRSQTWDKSNNGWDYNDYCHIRKEAYPVNRFSETTVNIGIIGSKEGVLQFLSGTEMKKLWMYMVKEKNYVSSLDQFIKEQTKDFKGLLELYCKYKEASIEIIKLNKSQYKGTYYVIDWEVTKHY